ncbi:MAG: hypothetical protein KatS3mg035_1024 [Bacteroidia bacterium]|nr:MAG: hypothetical protein KatS3mg035_1024 [Bacteroidia bacterium]
MQKSYSLIGNMGYQNGEQTIVSWSVLSTVNTRNLKLLFVYIVYMVYIYKNITT